MSSQGWAVSVACPSCGSILDATDPNLTVLQRHQRGMRIAPQIPLGKRGTWHGAPWEAIGCQQVTITVEETDYSWMEYVLFNPYRGFLYLSEYEGHWNVIEKLHERPALDSQGGRPAAQLAGKTFKHFQTATARTTFAAGEFPWEVRLGDEVISRDFVAPPFLLSAESSDNETTWSLGSYTPQDVVRKAFGIESAWSPASGVFANQPNPHTARAGSIWKACGLLLMGLFLMLAVNVVGAAKEQVFEGRYSHSFVSDDSATAFVTDLFTLQGRPSNVDVEIDSDADNNWAFFSIALINDSSGLSREATKQVSYFYGTDSDGRWSEGSRRGKVRMSAVPSGRYFLRIGTEGGEAGKPAVNYSVRVRRDVPGYGFYALAFAAILLPAILLWIPGATFEQRRWAESDHAPVLSDDSDEDDDE
ncbi:MAG: DUF4178 domain-containing protein [Gemmatimonas sp.]